MFNCLAFDTFSKVQFTIDKKFQQVSNFGIRNLCKFRHLKPISINYNDQKIRESTQNNS